MKISTFLIAFICLAQSLAAQEFRGIWVDAFGPGFWNKEQVARLAEDCRKYNFNAVFVQVRRRGDAFYFPQAPNPDPRTTVLDPTFDALAEIIKECHGKEPRIEVHAWVTGYFLWAFDKPPRQGEHLFNRHPEYLTRDSIGQKIVGQGYYLDPGHPEVGKSLFNMAKDIVSRYDVDGFHWDYLRYPNQDSGYNPTALKRYQEEFGVKDQPLPSDPQFCEWRRRQVTDFMRWSTADLLEIKPKLVVSASVFSNYEDSRNHRFQDWVAWNQEGIIDLTIPMNFSPDSRFVYNPRADFAITNQGNRAIYIGQGAYMNKKEDTLQQLNYAREKGFNGTVLYSYRKPLPENQPIEVEKNTGVEIIVDNSEADVIGAWSEGNFGKFHGANYSYKGKGAGENHVRFHAKLSPGEYAVYEWHVAGDNRTDEAPFEIVHRDGMTVLKVNQQRNGSRWNLLGTFAFTNSAELRVTDAIAGEKQVVIADAIRFVMVSSDFNETTRQDNLKQSAIIDPEEERRRSNQVTAFSFLKEHFQTEWQPVPELSWKRKRSIIKGIVSDENGGPVYNADISIRLMESPDASQQLGSVSGGKPIVTTQRTDALGKFAFFDLHPGKYRLNAFGAKVEKQIEIKAGQIASVNLEVAPK